MKVIRLGPLEHRHPQPGTVLHHTRQHLLPPGHQDALPELPHQGRLVVGVEVGKVRAGHMSVRVDLTHHTAPAPQEEVAGPCRLSVSVLSGKPQSALTVEVSRAARGSHQSQTRNISPREPVENPASEISDQKSAVLQLDLDSSLQPSSGRASHHLLHLRLRDPVTRESPLGLSPLSAHLGKMGPVV